MCMMVAFKIKNCVFLSLNLWLEDLFTVQIRKNLYSRALRVIENSVKVALIPKGLYVRASFYIQFLRD